MRKLIEDTGVRWSDPRLGDFVETIKKIQTVICCFKQSCDFDNIFFIDGKGIYGDQRYSNNGKTIR